MNKEIGLNQRLRMHIGARGLNAKNPYPENSYDYEEFEAQMDAAYEDLRTEQKYNEMIERDK